jgi:hypothetical protein
MASYDRPNSGRHLAAALGAAVLWCALGSAAATATAAASPTTAPEAASDGGAPALLAALPDLEVDGSTQPACGSATRLPVAGRPEAVHDGVMQVAQSTSLCCRNGVLHQKTTTNGQTRITALGGPCPAGTPPC